MWSEVAWGIAIQVLSTGECRFCGFLEEGEGNKLRKVDTWLAGCGRVELGHKQCALCLRPSSTRPRLVRLVNGANHVSFD